MTASQHSTPTTIVFDLGNVLVGWDPYLPLADRMARDEWETFTAESGFFDLNILADNGVAINDLITHAGTQNPKHGELVKQYYERFDQSLTGPVPGVADLVKALKSSDVRLLGLSNWSDETFHHAAVAAPAIAELEEVVVSGREGVAKPDPVIFQRLLDRYKLVPDDTVFIDDSARNISAAAGLGFIALHFTSAAKLRQELDTLGLLP